LPRPHSRADLDCLSLWPLSARTATRPFRPCANLHEAHPVLSGCCFVRGRHLRVPDGKL